MKIATPLFLVSMLGCGARTGLNSEEVRPAPSCAYNQGPSCDGISMAVTSRDRFYRNPGLARARLRMEYPRLPRDLTDGLVMGSGGRRPLDSDVTTFLRVDNLLIVGGAMQGMAETPPFLLFYYVLADGAIQYSDFRNSHFGNVGTYYGIDPVRSGDTVHYNMAMPDDDCATLGTVSAISFYNGRLYTVDDSQPTVSAYAGFPDAITFDRSHELCR